MAKGKYTTKYDRVWKGKEWFSSWGSQKFIRTLTDEEAATLDGIERVHEPKPFVQCVGDNDGGLYCLKCESTRGFFVYKMHRGKQSNWYTLYKCSECGAREKKYYK